MADCQLNVHRPKTSTIIPNALNTTNVPMATWTELVTSAAGGYNVADFTDLVLHIRNLGAFDLDGFRYTFFPHKDLTFSVTRVVAGFVIPVGESASIELSGPTNPTLRMNAQVYASAGATTLRRVLTGRR